MARSKFEIKAQKELEADGYTVDWKIRPPRPHPYYNTDYFNLFDLLAHKAGKPLRWISIKGKAGIPTPHRRAIENFAMPKGNKKEIWYYRTLAGKGNKLIPKKITID